MGIAPTEISAIVNGRQQVEKFNRILAIANALAMPDSPRVILGLAPVRTPASTRLTDRRAVLHGAAVGTGAALTGGLLTGLRRCPAAVSARWIAGRAWGEHDRGKKCAAGGMKFPR